MQVAILGATGLVGRAMLKCLEDRPWANDRPRLWVSARSAGSALTFRGRETVCREVGPDSFAGVDIALFSAGGQVSRTFAPVAAAAGALVIDNSSAFRMDPQVPLVVPEINGSLVVVRGSARGGGIIANPNCSTIQIAMVVAPLERAFGVAEVHVTTLQAVSGAGQKGVTELRDQLQGRPHGPAGVFPRPIAFNVVPAIGPALADGSFEEEAKVVRELRKILARDDSLRVTCTATRVPVFNGHSAAVRIVCRREVTPALALPVLAGWPGLAVAADPHDFATPLDADGAATVHVGRLRQDPGDPRALLCWVVADNLLKGAAANAVQIGDLVAGQPGARGAG